MEDLTLEASKSASMLPPSAKAVTLSPLLLKHQGRSRREGIKVALALFTIPFLFGVVLAVSPNPITSGVGWAVIIHFALGAAWVLRFFRDFQPRPAAPLEAIVSPAHGVVDCIEETDEPTIMGGRCRRISIYLSLRDVHVQNAPISGTISFCKEYAGRFSRAIHKDAGLKNKHVLMGFIDPAVPNRKIALRLVSGIWIRRIVPWISVGEQVERSQRISLIRFGSRADLFVPLDADLQIALGDKVIGGETPIAALHD